MKKGNMKIFKQQQTPLPAVRRYRRRNTIRPIAPCIRFDFFRILAAAEGIRIPKSFVVGKNADMGSAAAKADEIGYRPIAPCIRFDFFRITLKPIPCPLRRNTNQNRLILLPVYMAYHRIR